MPIKVVALSSNENDVCALHDVIIVLSSNEVEKVGPSSYGVIVLSSGVDEVKSPSITNNERFLLLDMIEGSSCSEEETYSSSSGDVAVFSDYGEKVEGPSSYDVIAWASNGDEVHLSVRDKPSNPASLPLEEIHTKNTVGCTCIVDEKTYIVDEKILGSGGFGTVRRCTRKGTEERFALKTMKLKREGQQERYRHEAHLHKQCSGHPNVVNFVEKFETHSRVHMVMELCDGGALDTYLSYYPTGLPHLDIAAIILRQVMSAVHHIHGLGIVHRDIKSQNILLAFDADNKTMVIKLADFGLAARFRCQVDTDTVVPCRGIVGTKGYKAPEMLRGEEYGAAVDIWSTGIVLVEMLTGEYPKFLQSETTDDGGDDKKSDYDQVLDFNSGAQNKLGMCLRNLITGMLQPNPAKRITAAGALNHCWIRNWGSCKHEDGEEIFTKRETTPSSCNPRPQTTVMTRNRIMTKCLSLTEMYGTVVPLFECRFS